MISLQLKGAQLSCVLAEMTILIVSYGVGILKFQITIKNGKLSLKPQASTTLEDPQTTLALPKCLPFSNVIRAEEFFVHHKVRSTGFSRSASAFLLLRSLTITQVSED